MSYTHCEEIAVRVMMKNSLVVLLFLLPFMVKSATVECNIGLNVGIFHPTDAILQRYFDRSNICTYGVNCSVVNIRNNLGAFLKFQRFSFNVTDTLGDEHLRGNWFTFGLEKVIPISFVSLYGRLGVTLHYDSYDLFLSNIRLGFQPCLGIRLNVTRRIKPFFEIDYEYTKLSVPAYVNMIPTRHQEYLAGKDFQAGGILINAGISFTF